MPETDSDRAEFGRQVSDAYQQLYDLVSLRSHPLLDVLIPDPIVPRKDRAWRLHNLLLAAVRELDPGPEAPAYSRAWRRYRLMLCRYQQGLEPLQVMQEIAVSRRQFYREHEAAIEAVAEILWERRPPGHTSAEGPARVQTTAGEERLGLLRLEAARVAQAGRYNYPDEVTRTALGLLEERLHQRELSLEVEFGGPLAAVAVEKGLLRQLVLGTANYLIERADHASLCVTADTEDGTLCLTLAIDPPEALRPSSDTEMRERLEGFGEMAALGGAEVRPVYAGTALIELVAGFELRLPQETQRTIVVVDDNEDVLELFRRFLVPHGYRVLAARSAPEGLDLAVAVRPFAAVLDLMLPGQDGWDLLQTLLNRAETRDIPVLICSVLKQRELALSLGATAFLDKPVTEQALLEALRALERA